MPGMLLLGEAYGEQEEREGKAFVGPTGWELNRMLSRSRDQTIRLLPYQRV